MTDINDRQTTLDQISIGSYYLRRSLILLLRSFCADTNHFGPFSPVIGDRIYDGEGNRNLVIELSDLDDEGNLEYREGLYVVDEDISISQNQPAEHSSDFLTGRITYGSFETHSFAIHINFTDSGSVRAMSDTLRIFLVSLKRYFKENECGISDVQLVGYTPVSRVKDSSWQGFHRAIRFRLLVNIAVDTVPEAALFQYIDFAGTAKVLE